MILNILYTFLYLFLFQIFIPFTHISSTLHKSLQYKKIIKKYLDRDKNTLQKSLIREEKCLATNDFCEEAVGWANFSAGGPCKAKGWQEPELD